MAKAKKVSKNNASNSTKASRAEINQLVEKGLKKLTKKVEYLEKAVSKLKGAKPNLSKKAAPKKAKAEPMVKKKRSKKKAKTADIAFD